MYQMKLVYCKQDKEFKKGKTSMLEIQLKYRKNNTIYKSNSSLLNLYPPMISLQPYQA